jgi:hypothetical protein
MQVPALVAASDVADVVLAGEPVRKCQSSLVKTQRGGQSGLRGIVI